MNRSTRCRRCWRGALLAAALVLVALQPLHAAPLRVGDDAPAFELQDLAGRSVALADLAGPGRRPGANGVIIVFFATWCPPCRRELPAVDALVEGFAKRGVTVLLVGHGEDREKLARFLGGLGVRRVTALADPSGGTAKRYGVRMLPTVFAVSSTGTVQDLLLGETRDVEGEFGKLADALTAK